MAISETKNRKILISKILKLAYYRNYCIDSCQILHSDKDYEILFVGGKQTKMSDGRHF